MTRDDAVGHYKAARESWKAGDVSAARSRYQQAIDTDPGFALPHYDLATMLDATDGAAARRHLKRFVELAADDAKLATLVSDARARLARRTAATPRRPGPVPNSGSRAAKTSASKVAKVLVAWWIIVALFVVAVAIGNLLFS